jgi:hypothetical protein
MNHVYIVVNSIASKTSRMDENNVRNGQKISASLNEIA